ncbi:hypothetical protein KKF91_15030 [Myxococcota bacterium]|nr:hypothetical protein [Myxococcota bacterium]
MLWGHRAVGARIFWWDPLVLISATALSALAWPLIGGLAGLPLLVVGHFFLFCNVFRVGTRRELVWAVALALAAVGWSAVGRLTLLAVTLSILPVSVGVILDARRASDYHGWGARKKDR